MSLALRSSFFLVALAAVAPATLAFADMPGGGGPDCEMQDGCVQCEKPLDDDDSAYDSCVADAEDDGLLLSCSDAQGSSDVEYWCPEGVDANAGCSAAAGPVTQGAAFMVTCVAALGLSLMRRARRK
jgi:hypothetical protein